MAYDGLNQLTQAGSFLSSLTNPAYGVKRDIVTVNGFQEARDYKLFRGERISMIDSMADILYIKQCDELGKYTLKVYECKDITRKFEEENTPANISQSQLNELNEKIDKLTKMLGVQNEHNAQQLSEQQQFDFSDNSICGDSKKDKQESRANAG